MVYFYSLIVSFLMMFSSSANAVINKGYQYCAAGCLNGYYSTKAAACAGLYAAGGDTTGWYDSSIDACWGQSGGNPKRFGPWGISAASVCPANSKDVAGQCTCSAGFEEKDGKCEKINPCPSGQHEEGGACVPDNCKADEVRVNGLCVKEPECPSGQTRVNGVCKLNGCPVGEREENVEMGGDSVEYYCEKKGGKQCQKRVSPGISVSWTDSDGKRHTEYTGTATYTGAECKSGTGTGTSGIGTGGDHNNGTGGTGTGSTGTGGTGSGTGNTGGTGSGNTGTGSGNVPGPGSGVGGTPVMVPIQNDGLCPPGSVPRGSGCWVPVPEQPPDKDGACPAGTVKVGTTCASVAPGTGGNAPQSGSGGSGGAGAVNKANDPREPASDGTCEAGTTKIGNKCYLTTVPGTGNGNGNGNGEGEKSGFGGACASGFTCEGDAVQCAIAREQHIRSCKMFDDPSPESQLYDQFKGKTGNQTGDLPGNDSINLAGRIDTSDALGGGGGCIQDLNVTVWNQSVTLPFSQICPYLAQLGNVLLAVSFLLALRIVTRG